jgi:hypothetical protein
MEISLVKMEISLVKMEISLVKMEISLATMGSLSYLSYFMSGHGGLTSKTMRVSARKVVIEKKMSSAVKNDGFNQNSPGLNQQTCGFDQHKSEFHQEQLVLTIFQGKKSACSLVKSISVHDFPWRPHHFWHVDHISPEFFQAISATFHHVPR